MAYLSDKVLKKFVERLALLETPSGFAIFNINEELFDYPDGIWSWLTEADISEHVLNVVGYIKVNDKSVTRRSDGPGEELSMLITRVCRSGIGKELYVEDKELRSVIYSNLKIKCSDDEYVLGEVMWGLKNLMYDLVFEERANLTRGYHLAPCDGLKKCISEFNLNISLDAIDEEFLINAGGLYRCHVMLKRTGRDLRKGCDRYVPGISSLFKKDLDYAEVMAKILTPGLEPDWDFCEKYKGEVLEALQVADAAAKDAREEVGYRMYQFLFATFLNLRLLPERINKAVVFLNSLTNERSVVKEIAEKRSLSDSLLSSCEVESSQDTFEDGASKRAPD